MNRISVFITLALLIGTSCKKQGSDMYPQNPGIQRKVQFSLYTDKDFSTDSKNITFEVFIENSMNQVLWDSTLATMKIKDIPDLAHKIVIEKPVPDNNSSLLRVGFRYAIENVGNSWYIDSSSADATFKKVDFNFQ